MVKVEGINLRYKRKLKVSGPCQRFLTGITYCHYLKSFGSSKYLFSGRKPWIINLFLR